MLLEGAVAVITGAGGVMGSAIASGVAAQGGQVVCLDVEEAGPRRLAEGLRSQGAVARAVCVDVRDGRSVERAVGAVLAEFGRVDLLVNNAASFRAIGPVWEVGREAWWDDVSTNLLGPFLCCRAVLPVMVERNAGVIINMSGAGFGDALPGGSGYCASKAALIRLTETLALELGTGESKRGVKGAGLSVYVYGMEPAFVAGAMNERVAASRAGSRWLPFVAEDLGTGSVGDPRAVADAVCRLVALSPKGLSGLTMSYRDDFACLARLTAEVQRRGWCKLSYRRPT